MVDSLKGVNCPNCHHPFFFTELAEDFEQHKAEHPDSPVVYHPGIDVRGWSATRTLSIGGRELNLTRRDIQGNRIYPVRCPRCRLVFIGRLDIVNLAAVEKYERTVRPYHPPSVSHPPVEPKWNFKGQTVAEFCADVKATRNPMVRSFVVRALRAAGVDLVELRGLDEGTPFQK